MAKQTTGSLPQLLIPGLNMVIAQVYDEHPKIYSQIFHTITSKRDYEEFVGVSGYGLFQDKQEGGGITFVSQQQGFSAKLRPKTKALGIQITLEEIQDNLYAEVGADRMRLLRFSHLQTLEYDAAFILANAFLGALSPAPVGLVYWDEQPLCSQVHPMIGLQGGTQSNMLSTPAPLSEASMEDMGIQIGLATNEDGFKSKFPMKNMIVQESNKYNACRIYKTLKQPGTNNNDVNALMLSGDLPPLIVTPYLPAANPWFITIRLPNPKQGLVLIDRMPLEVKSDNSIDTWDAKFTMVTRYIFGAVDSAHCIYGSNAV